MQIEAKPNLFVVGFPRTGTSSLHYYFSQHPDIYITKEKELHYFANEVLEELFNDNSTKNKTVLITKTQFNKHYEDVKNEKVITNFGPYIILSDKAPRRIYKFNNNSKILIMVRNPLDFLYSLHTQFCRLGLCEQEDLLDAFENSKNEDIRYLNFYSWVDYRSKIERFTNLFPRENIKIVFFKEFKKDTKSTYKEILRFAGVNENVKTDLSVVNRARKQRFPNFVKTVEKIMERHDLSSFFEMRTTKLLSSIFFKLSLKEIKREKLDNAVVRKLKSLTKHNVVEFDEFLKENDFVNDGFDLLEYWNY